MCKKFYLKTPKLNRLFGKTLTALAMTAFSTAAMAEGSVVVNRTNFPDENLYNYLLEFDEDGNGILEGWEYESTYFYGFNCADVVNFKGLELFPITRLNIYYNWIEENPLASVVKTIDLSMLPDLEGLFIYDVLGLETLDISRNTKLTDLRLSYCPALKDIKWASSLESLDIQDLQSLSSINGSDMPKLRTLESGSHAHVSSVENFNFTGHKNIESIYIHGNDDFSHILNTFHVENCANLTYLEVNSSTVQDFTMKNLPGFEVFYIKNTTAENVNIQECPELRRVLCEENELGTLQLSNNPKLWDVDCHDNKLKTLIADNCPSMESVWAWDNQLMWLDMKDVVINPYHVSDNGEGNTDFRLDNQNPSVQAVKISPTEVGLRVHSRLDVNRVLNLKAKGMAMEPKEIFVDGIRYFVIYNDGPSVESLVGASGHSYQYDTKWPYPFVNGNSADNLLPVTYHVTSWTKHQAFIKLSESTVKGVYGQPAPQAPTVTRSQDYDGKLTWSSSNEKVVKVNAETGELTIVGAGTATIYVKGAETDYRLAPATVSYVVTIDKAPSPVLTFQDDVVNATVGQTLQANPLTINGLFEGTIQYTSSDPEIAEVAADGTVICKQEGEVTIKAEGRETSNVYAAIKAEYKLVIAPADAIEAVSSDAKAEAAYNLSGRRVNTSDKGIVIVGGRKVLNK